MTPAALLSSVALVGETVSPESECCVWLRLVLVQAYGAAVVDRQPKARWHLATRPVERDAPVRCAVEAGMALELPQGTGRWVDGAVHIVQGWRPNASGHAFLVWKPPVGAVAFPNLVCVDSVAGREGWDVRMRVRTADAVAAEFPEIYTARMVPRPR